MGDHMQIVAVKNVEPQYVEMRVPLYSYGCERKIKNSLSHLKGIYSVSVDYRQQKVTVWGICNKHDVLARVRSKRRAARFWEDVVQEETLIQVYNDYEAVRRRGVEIEKKYSTKLINSNPGLISLFRTQSLSFKLSVKKVFNRSFSFT